MIQWIDGLPCELREPFDLSFLEKWGTVFRVFDQQDSGNLCFGIQSSAGRLFLKFAGARPPRYSGEPAEAVGRLRRAASLYQTLSHPNLIQLLDTAEVPGGFAAVFRWTDGLCMGKQYATRPRFLALPDRTKLQIFDSILNFHLHSTALGYVAVDFYDGCILYEEETGNTLLCDIDAYEQVPYRNPVGRMYGSSRFMSPEEFQLGAPIDEVTTVYTMGAAAFALFAREGGRRREDWPLTAALYEVASQAVQPEREARFASLAEFSSAWRLGTQKFGL